MANKTRKEKDLTHITDGLEKIVIAKIKEERKKQGLTQEDIAEKLGVSQNTYKNIETGVGELSFPRFLALTKILGMTDVLGNEVKEITEADQTILYLKFLAEHKDSLLETAESLQTIVNSIKILLNPLKEKNDSEGNRVNQINLKATEEEKALIKEFAKEKDLSLIDTFLELIKKEKEKKQ
jgi:transcriptional regulator with XRE-family HTH domain